MPSLPLGFGPGQAAAMLLISDPDVEVVVPRDLLQQLYGLTASEAKMAVKLSSGASFETVGEELSITYQTARNHLKAIFAKTDTHRQAQLVALVNKFSDFG